MHGIMMHWFDISAGVLLLIGCLWSCWRGFMREVVSLLGMLAIILLAARAYPHVVRLLEPLTSLTWLRQTIGSSAIFLAAILAYIMLEKLGRRLLKATRPSVRQRILGGLVGVVKTGVVVAALLILWTHFNPQAATRLTAESNVAPLLLNMAQLMTPLLPAEMRTELQRFDLRNQSQIGKYLPLPLGRSNASSSTSAVHPKTNAMRQPNSPSISPSDDQALRRLIRKRLRDP